jgi:uncharacterized RDD family membrane protein YckC
MEPSTIQADTQFHGVLSPRHAQLKTPVASAGARMLAYTVDCLIITLVVAFLPLPRFIGQPLGAMLDSLARFALHDATASLQGQAPTLPQYVWQFGHATGWAFVMFVLAESVVEAGYFIFWEMLTGGRSPGKAMVGLRVVRRDGRPINFRSSAVRNLMRLVDMLPASYVVGFVAMMLSERRQRLGDTAAGTVVIRPANSA